MNQFHDMFPFFTAQPYLFDPLKKVMKISCAEHNIFNLVVLLYILLMSGIHISQTPKAHEWQEQHS
jgi:hypothetical protein